MFWHDYPIKQYMTANYWYIAIHYLDDSITFLIKNIYNGNIQVFSYLCRFGTNLFHKIVHYLEDNIIALIKIFHRSIHLIIPIWSYHLCILIQISSWRVFLNVHLSIYLLYKYLPICLDLGLSFFAFLYKFNVSSACPAI